VVDLITLERLDQKELGSLSLEHRLLEESRSTARIPHRGEVRVSTTHINWQLSSNGLKATRDFVNRAIINRVSKRSERVLFRTLS